MLSLQDVHALTPRTCDCYFTWQKGFPDMKISPCDGEIILDYSGGPNLIT